jgi:hypothetical protein
MAVKPDIVGRGWSFPFRFTGIGRVNKIVGVEKAFGIEKINMAIRQILGTKLGSRVIDRDFGSDLRGIIFEPIDQLSATRLQLAVSEAIQTWEKRVELLNVEVSLLRSREGVLETRVEYQVITTQQIGNLVYPFYLTPEMRVQGQITIG